MHAVEHRLGSDAGIVEQSAAFIGQGLAALVDGQDRRAGWVPEKGRQAAAEKGPNFQVVVAGREVTDQPLRSKKELIEKFIDQNLPAIEDAAQIPETFETYWEAERADAFDKLVKEEQLDADKLKKVIDRYVYTGQAPLPDPDIADIIVKPLKILERGPTKQRVFDRVIDYVATFIRGMAA